ncbi:MAG: hypothetical protein NT120_04975 [Candidatus Aenigmarchaeota archaeon]|nr:hypothetical protein [Candidatus Aenigmarchaeota archaeon]
MFSNYVWFLIAIMVTLSNVLVSFVAYYYLQSQKKLSKGLVKARDLTFYYSVGMMFILIFSIGFFILFVPV